MASVNLWPDTDEEALPPGAMIQQTLVELGLTQQALADRMRRNTVRVQQILHGRRPITLDTALELELVLGIPASVWLELETRYQIAGKRLDLQGRIMEEVESLELFPVSEMIQLGWIEQAETRVQQALALLGYFGVTSFSQLSKPSILAPVFRSSDLEGACPYALAAWLRQGTIEAHQIKVGRITAKGLQSALAELRLLTRCQPAEFRPRIVETCATHGVAVVFVPRLAQSVVSAAAYWIKKKGIVQLGFQFRTDDHFWFSFFHELGHLMCDRKKQTFLDDVEPSAHRREWKANLYAHRALIPATAFERLQSMSHFDTEVITTFSQELGIAPGIVVGCLEREGLIPEGHAANRLKVKLDWGQDVSAR